MIQQKVGVEELATELRPFPVDLEKLSTFLESFFPAKAVVAFTHSLTAFFFPWHAFSGGPLGPLLTASWPGSHESFAGDDYSVEKSSS